MQRKPNQKFQYRGKPQNEHRLNNEITATEVRLIGEGIEPAVYSLQQALAFAVELGVDLVEVSPNAVNAGFILRGLRSGLDFEYEQSIAFANKELDPDIETVFLLSSPSYSNISSTIVRDIIANKGDYTKFIPKGLTL